MRAWLAFVLLLVSGCGWNPTCRRLYFWEDFTCCPDGVTPAPRPEFASGPFACPLADGGFPQCTDFTCSGVCLDKEGVRFGTVPTQATGSCSGAACAPGCACKRVSANASACTDCLALEPRSTSERAVCLEPTCGNIVCQDPCRCLDASTSKCECL